jgi:hypothetical protein
MKRLTLLLCVVLSGLTQADEFERQHGSHAHGVAQLDLVLDGQTLELQLSSPAVNLVGFEHPARAAKDRQKVGQVVATLKQGDAMLRLPEAAQCVLERAEVDESLLGDQDPDHDHDHDHDHNSNSNSNSNSGQADGSHADIDVAYRFHCVSPDKLDSIGVELLHQFPGLESLRVQMITPSSQRGLTLSADNTEIEL